jgi:hypothetical protein
MERDASVVLVSEDRQCCHDEYQDGDIECSHSNPQEAIRFVQVMSM